MLFFSCSRAESTLAVTFSAFCTTRVCLIKLVKSRGWSLPVPLEWYSSCLLVSDVVCSACVLSPYLRCWWFVSQFLGHSRRHHKQQQHQGTRVSVPACVRTGSGAACHCVRFRGVRRQCPVSFPPALPGWASFWLPVSRCRYPEHRGGQCPRWEAARWPWRRFGGGGGRCG